MTILVQMEGEVIWWFPCCIIERTVQINFGQFFAKHGEMARTAQMPVYAGCFLLDRLAYLDLPNVFHFNIVFPAVLPTESQPVVLLTWKGGASCVSFRVSRIIWFYRREFAGRVLRRIGAFATPVHNGLDICLEGSAYDAVQLRHGPALWHPRAAVVNPLAWKKCAMRERRRFTPAVAVATTCKIRGFCWMPVVEVLWTNRQYMVVETLWKQHRNQLHSVCII